MEFKINKLKIENFKCFENLETDLSGKNKISGANESGKSSFASAILWCLTGKDVEGNTTFETVPKGKYGTVSPCVALDCLIDDKPVELKREYKAKFTRDKKFSDYAVVTYINGIETGVRKFQDWINQKICNEQVFKILSNPKTFIEDCPKETKELDWQAQRRMLMDIIGGNKSDAELIQDKEEFEILKEPLNRYETATQYLTFLKKQYSETQKKIDSFDIRIEEQEKSIQETEHSEKEIEVAVATIKENAAAFQQQNKQYRESQQAQQRESVVMQIKAFQNEKDNLLKQYNEDIAVFNNTKAKYETEARLYQQKLDEKSETLKRYSNALLTLKNSKVSEICETCGQKLKDSDIKTAKKKLVERIENGNKVTTQAREEALMMHKRVEEIQNKVKNLMEPVYPPKAIEMQQVIETLTMELAQIPEAQDLSNYSEKMEEFNQQMDSLKKEFLIIERNKQIEKEIEKIEQEHKETIETLSNLQELLDATKKFISFKCQHAEESINNLFENVKFNLFQQNKSNDEIKETCSLTFKGIKYNDLSYSTKIIAGLEVVKAFQKYYNVTVPIILDNAESITETLNIDSQAFYMFVKPENCPKCGGESGRRTEQGTWVCKSCGNEWKKQIEIKGE